MPQENIVIRGARENNLKNVDLEIPRHQLTVFTGVSGSDKSSLAFDTLYAEGQSRYVESLSAYARQFLGLQHKPDVDAIEGLSPAIAIEQQKGSHNPRSTVGTITEIYDHLRLLWARVGLPHCPNCGRAVQQQTLDQIIAQINAWPARTRLIVLAPVISRQKGRHEQVLADMRKQGYARARVDGEMRELTDEIRLEKTKHHTIEIVIDRLTVNPEAGRERLADALETAARLTDGLIAVALPDRAETLLFSERYACPDCGVSLPELSPRMFSFNSPYGACPDCAGLGFHRKVAPELLVPDPTQSLLDGAIQLSGWENVSQNSISKAYCEALAARYGFTLDAPFAALPDAAKQALFHGTGAEELRVQYGGLGSPRVFSQPFEGLISILERRYAETQSESSRHEIERFMYEQTCASCHGERLRPVMLAVTVNGLSIAEFCRLTIEQAQRFLETLELPPQQAAVAAPIVSEACKRLEFLSQVGLGYLTLARGAASLSGGEGQRIRLASQIGSGLTDVLYVLDEPSVGLHPRDNDRLLTALFKLRDLGNTLIVVEHDEATIRRADHVVDIGPGAGARGGEIVAAGRPAEIAASARSATGQYLSGRAHIPLPGARRAGNGQAITIRGAAANNLKHIDVSLPLGTFSCVTGVSGSGKSSLINEILYKKLAAVLNRARSQPGAHQALMGYETLDKVIQVDQSPIGRSPRSNPATYTGLFGDIRNLFAQTPEAKARNFGAGRFSFNVKGGRCEACQGDGLVKIEMHFLPDLFVPCEVRRGTRFNRETLDVTYKDQNIAEVLDLTAQEAHAFFRNIPKLERKLRTLCEVGLGYLKLGQAATTLSGGEAQRVKLATELMRARTGPTLYVLDEPTTGLHAADVKQLILVLQKLVDEGHTVVVIEHNLDLIKNADYILDLGPEGGDAGGALICAGTPEEVAACPASHTGRFLARLLERGPLNGD